ncbi:DUF3800 domain-containing protein [Corynebacterium rhinophilum]|uniref:DUF3800 domain-containing protein n=1 Tax=Corynebacterium rhinophilum TaxID=3050197 RepID=UPI00254A6B94|nr:MULTISPECIES: DUF3800 domain-containing protein [unclassified Corynebacterium]MDK8646613.1 DUF3800 domain-containing protein [Corynebacterium sp. MSK082]MDK8699094.1 DUF3800 domain-containing protein [Corynebacterium sp. MSK192]
MLYSYVDESASQNDDYYLLSALILDEKGKSQLEKGLSDLLAAETEQDHLWGIEELHGYEIMQQKGDWSHVPFRLSINVYNRALSIINDSASALFVECINRSKQERRYVRPYDPRDLAISFTLERINEFCTWNEEKSHVLLDDHYTAEESRKNFIKYRTDGTFGYKSSKLARVESFDFYDSKTKWGLQAADLCTYIANRIISKPSTNPKVVKLQNNMWNRLDSIKEAGQIRIWP